MKGARRLRLALAMVAVAVAGGTAGACGRVTSSRSNSTATVMPTTDEDAEVRAPAGQVFEIELEDVPGTGAIWYYQSDSSDVELISQESRPTDDRIGGARRRLFKFRIENSGTYALRFELKRVWEAEVRRRKTFAVHVD